MKGRVLAVSAVLLMAAGAAGLVWFFFHSAAGPGQLAMSNLMRDYSQPVYASLGQRIYLTGQDPQGRITHSMPGVAGPGMMGGMSNSGMMRLACANCHGPDGRGGLVFGDGATAADLRHLIKEQTPPYNLALFTRAVTQGIDNQGMNLDPMMPRWIMPPADLRALWAYVKTLQQ